MSQIDVLNLEWASSPSRDTIMSTLVCNYLRFQGLKVHQGSIFDGFQQLHKIKPKLFFIANSTGAQENLDMMTYAKSRGFKGLSMVSEGNFRPESEYAQEMIWGWNKAKILQEDLQLQWSERTRDITLHHHPELLGKILVGGGVGFDHYKINPLRSRAEFLAKYGKSHYEKIVGVGLWDFGVWEPEDTRFAITSKLVSLEARQRFLQDRDSFESILHQVVRDNPNHLFLLKEHPGVLLGRRASAIEGLEKYPNTLILKTEEGIFDCIAVSDFWVVYESTTALEAWLLGKETCLLNPSGRDFPRDQVHTGSPDYSSIEQMNEALRCFDNVGHLPRFSDYAESRMQVIRSTIQWDDGYNHVRVGNAILDLLSRESHERNKETFRSFKLRFKQHLRWRLAQWGLKISGQEDVIQRFKNWNNREIQAFQSKLMQDQIQFYNRQGMTAEQLREIKAL